MEKRKIIGRVVPFLAGLLAGGGGVLAQTSLTVLQYSGTSQTFEVAEAGKIYFSSGSLVVDANGNGTTATVSVSLIRKITFASSDATGGISANTQNDDVVAIYPNPATNYVTIAAPANTKVQVGLFSIDGKQILAGTYANGAQIDIAQLRAGIYLVNINNKNFKLVKQ
ncbi:MAG: T9SS type A sorting domain-containing protein [Edaphocola sp.]